MDAEHKKFTTGIVICYFDRIPALLGDIISTSKENGDINETLVLVLPVPFVSNVVSSSWGDRIVVAEHSKYIQGQKLYDVWHGVPRANETNANYIDRVLAELKRQYSHQQQIIIFDERHALL